MTIELLERDRADQSEELGGTPEVAPWFMTYNRHMADECTPRVYRLIPFPAFEFCGHSPWKEHAIMGHHGIEPYAKAAGMTVGACLQSMIANAPKRGAFCLTCPNEYCAQSYTGGE